MADKQNPPQQFLAEQAHAQIQEKQRHFCHDLKQLGEYIEVTQSWLFSQPSISAENRAMMAKLSQDYQLLLQQHNTVISGILSGEAVTLSAFRPLYEETTQLYQQLSELSFDIEEGDEDEENQDFSGGAPVSDQGLFDQDFSEELGKDFEESVIDENLYLPLETDEEEQGVELSLENEEQLQEDSLEELEEEIEPPSFEEEEVMDLIENSEDVEIEVDEEEIEEGEVLEDPEEGQEVELEEGVAFENLREVVEGLETAIVGELTSEELEALAWEKLESMSEEEKEEWLKRITEQGIDGLNEVDKKLYQLLLEATEKDKPSTNLEGVNIEAMHIEPLIKVTDIDIKADIDEEESKSFAEKIQEKKSDKGPEIQK